MATEITQYFNNTELPYNLEDKKLIKFKGFKINGKANGLCKVGYINKYIGYYYEEVNFIDNKKIGPYKTYWIRNLIEEGTYINNFKNLIEEGTYINNFKNGPYKQYYIGNICEEGIYENDFKNGPYKIYYDNGDIEEGIYINNFKNGPYKKYYSNGYIYEEGIYDNNKKN